MRIKKAIIYLGILTMPVLPIMAITSCSSGNKIQTFIKIEAKVKGHNASRIANPNIIHYITYSIREYGYSQQVDIYTYLLASLGGSRPDAPVPYLQIDGSNTQTTTPDGITFKNISFETFYTNSSSSSQTLEQVYAKYYS